MKRTAIIIVWLAWRYFAIDWWLGALAIPLVFVFVTNKIDARREAEAQG